MSEEDGMAVIERPAPTHPLAGAVLVTVACPACGTAHTEVVRPGNLTITGCRRCGHAR